MSGSSAVDPIKTGQPDDGPPKKNREDYKKQKELDEARKSGLEPAEQDEFGQDINPHIPQYIKDAPWYLTYDGPTLTHQRVQEDKVKRFDNEAWYKKGVTRNVATKFRKGACENCGAITHKKVDCLERPRKIGAKYTGEDFAPDEHVNNPLAMDFEGKRDRWNGYDTTAHDELIEEFTKVEEAKRQLKAESLHNNEPQQRVVSKSDSEEDEEPDEYKYTDTANMPGTKFDNKKRQTVRNLRIREDTAKYLLNLDTNSAYYDPKSRAMRDNPLKGSNKKPSELAYAGDNFVRSSGKVKEITNLQLFSWEATQRGTNVHLQAEPTKAALLHKEYVKRKDDFKSEVSESIVDKYGGKEHITKAPPRELLLGTTEEYVEYSRTGKVVRGQEKVVPRSKYQEDVYVHGHTQIYGSFFEKGQWGYKCCRALQKQAYCTGIAGRSGANVPMKAPPVEEEEKEDVEEPKSLMELHQERMVGVRKEKKKKEQEDIENPLAREERLKKVLVDMEEQEAKEAAIAKDDRKRSYNSMAEVAEPTEEQMEAYKLKKHMAQDPMSKFKDTT